MAKHLASHYLPGRRGLVWRKIKPRHSIPCVIIGYRQGRAGVASLLVAAPWRGKLQYAAELASGLPDEQRAKLVDRLSKRVRPKPVVRCPKKARWVEPALLCEVRYFQRTDGGRLRDASFYRLIGGAD